MSPRVAYALCGTPRVGGNWLCELLAEAGLGRPDEYLEARVRDPLMVEWAVPEVGYLPELWRRRAPGGVFGIKLLWGELAYPWVRRFEDALPPAPARFVFQHRRDVGAQADSWLTARETDQWFGPSRLRIRFPDGWRLPYEETIRRREAAWRRWFRRRGLRPLAVAYEDLSADPSGTVARVRDHVLA